MLKDYKKKELIEMILEARYGKETVQNANEYQNIIFNSERSQFNSYNKFELAIYLDINHNIKVYGD